MASPAPKPPAGNRSDEALDILRRLEPVLSRIDERQCQQDEDIAELKGGLSRIDEHQRKQSEDIAELKGRISQLPTLWQLATTMLAINSGIVAVAALIVVLIRFASGHG